ncbi:MAG: translation elongation factor Ts [Bacteroidales bacterium]
MEIKAVDVAKLRKMTGAGMMDCKRALVESECDFDKAKEIIREKGKLVAAKRADRETSEGAVIAKVSNDKKKAILISLGCETDFVAQNQEFQDLANAIADAAINSFPADKDALMQVKLADGRTIQAAVTEQTGKSGEKHVIAFYNTIEAEFIDSYIHMNGKVATIVGFNKTISHEAGKEIAMQITAMSPVSINRDSCPQEIIDKEMEMYRQQIAEEGKPANLVDRIAEGKLHKFFKESTLEDQAFTRDTKISVKDYLKSVDAEVKVLSFSRFSLND